MITKRLLIILVAALITIGAAAQNTHSSSSATKRVTWRQTVPQPTLPPTLVFENVTFSDANGDLRIDANEMFSIELTLRNVGKGNAYMIKPDVRANFSATALVFSELATIKSIAPGRTEVVRIMGKSSQSLPDGTASIILSAREGNGFNPDDHTLNVSCHAFRPPKVVMGQYLFASENGGVPAPGQVLTLKMIVQNDGESPAQNVRVDFTLPRHVYQGGETSISIPRLEAGEQKLIEFPFFANKEYQGETLVIDTRLSESYGRYAMKIDRMPSVNLSKSLDKSTSTTIEARATASVQPVKGQTISLISDVDEDIPVTTRVQPNIFALVIGNEIYQNSRDINVPFANSDASTFSDYMTKTIGLPSSNITLVHNATAARMHSEIERIAKLAKNYTDLGGEQAEIILYYAGHGFTDKDRNGYLLPVDVLGSNIKQGVRTATMYNLLASSGARKVSVFVDACFSGETRGSVLLEGRGVIIEPNQETITGNIVVFTATRKDEIAYAYNDKLHGMFTYYLLSKIKESAGDVTYSELSDYLTKTVKYQSILVHNTEQTPDIIVSPTVQDVWSDWRLTAN